MIDYDFSEISINNFRMAVLSEKLSPRHIDDIVRWCKGKDISEITDLINSENAWVRRCVTEVIWKIGDKKIIIEAVKKEEDTNLLLFMLKCLMSCTEGLEEIIFLLDSKDTVIKESAIDMFRRAGKSELLFPLIFDNDNELVGRIKRYIEEADAKDTNS